MRRVPPAFPPASWNVHHATLNGDPRTNNVCEGWNNKFVHLVGHQHPSIWKCIRAFQADHEAVDTLLVQAATGQPPRKRIRRENVQLQTRLSNLCQEYQNGTRALPDFLRGVGHLVRFWTNMTRMHCTDILMSAYEPYDCFLRRCKFLTWVLQYFSVVEMMLKWCYGINVMIISIYFILYYLFMA